MAATWYVADNRLTHDALPEPLNVLMSEPYPPFWWYVSNGRLTHKGLPSPIDEQEDTPEEAPDRCIRVYDISEPQDGFDHNGLAVLDPSECISNKEFNARWDITLTHPLDKWNKWHWLVGQNILKVNRQLFRIDEVENIIDESGAYVSAHAKHISYDLADIWVEYSGIGEYNSIPHEPVRTGKEYMDQLMRDRVPDTEYQGYSFDIHSDISVTEGEMSGEVRDQTYLGALIGNDDCFVNRFGGELYRDNFFLSINSEMQNSKKQAFCIRYGADMVKIKQTIDYSVWVTYLKTEDNYADQWAVSHNGSEWIIHHHKQKRVHFNYPDSSNTMEKLAGDSQAYWNTVNTPKVTYEVEISTIKDDPKYKDFLDLQDYDVGDTGTVYCELLDISTEQKIMAIKRNELTGEIISITLGNMQDSLIRPSYMGNTVSSGNTVSDKQLAAAQEQIDDLTVVSLVNKPIATVYNQFLVTADGEFILYT